MILPLQEHVLSYSMYHVLQVFFRYTCMLTYIYLLYICSSLLIGGTKKSYIFTENDQFTSSCTWEYQGSYSNQNGYIITKKFKKSAPVSDLKSNN